MHYYGPDFYEQQASGSRRSAEAVVPMLLELFPSTTSVVDVGCGVGTWLSVFQANGVETVLGLDGPYVREEDLLISPEHFAGTDLTHPFELDRRFDLVTSFEVAEHLPATKAASFVAEICKLADHVVFSAAIPGQGGENHVNESWPSYWIPLFEAEGYGARDPLRPRLWNLDSVAIWYRQNVIVFEKGVDSEPVLDLVHPGMLERIRRMDAQPSLRQVPALVSGSIRRNLNRRFSANK